MTNQVKYTASGGGGNPGPPGAQGDPGVAGSGGGGTSEFTIASGGNVATGGTQITLDNAPVNWPVRVGKMAVGVGLSTCEIWEASAISGALVTASSKFHFPHAVGERVMFFNQTRVPIGWWGIQANDSLIDSRFKFQCALNAVRRTAVGSSFPLILEGQNKTIYVSGPHYIPQNIGLENLFINAKTTTPGYTGPMDGPDNPTYTTNFMSGLCQSEDRYVYSQASNLFTVVDAAGNPLADNNINVNSPMMFAPDGNGLTAPSGLVAGRLYCITENPTSSTFRLGLVSVTDQGGTTISFGSDGAGFVGGQVVDNCKIFARRLVFNGSNVGQITFTNVNISTNVITTDVPHGLVADDVVRFNNGTQPTGGGGGNRTLPPPLEEGLKRYWVIASGLTTTDFKVSDTQGGPEIPLTALGNGHVIAAQKALNGLGWSIQQPSYCEHIRCDNFKGFAVRVRSQQSHWQNFEAINNGTAIELGNEFKHGANFLYMSTVNIEQSDCRNMLVRAYVPDIHLRDVHIEEADEVRNFVHFDVQAEVENFRIAQTYISSDGNSPGRVILRVNSGVVGGVDYAIDSLRGTFSSISGRIKAIQDYDRGIELDMADDFGIEGIGYYQSWSTNSSPVLYNDLYPFRLDTIDGGFESWGTQKNTAPYRNYVHAAQKTADMNTWRNWKSLGAATVTDLPTGTFTLNAHGLVEGQRVHTRSGFIVTPNAPFKWIAGGQVAYVRNQTTNTFQLSRVPSSNVVTFASMTGNSFTIRIVPTQIPLRINKEARIVVANNTAPASADLNAGEVTMWFDSTNGAAKVKWMAKQADGTVRNGELALV